MFSLTVVLYLFMLECNENTHDLVYHIRGICFLLYKLKIQFDFCLAGMQSLYNHSTIYIQGQLFSDTVFLSSLSFLFFGFECKCFHFIRILDILGILEAEWNFILTINTIYVKPWNINEMAFLEVLFVHHDPLSFQLQNQFEYS